MFIWDEICNDVGHRNHHTGVLNLDLELIGIMILTPSRNRICANIGFVLHIDLISMDELATIRCHYFTGKVTHTNISVTFIFTALRCPA